MGNYMVIVEIGQAVVGLLQTYMVADTLPKKEQIGLCNPKEPGEYSIGVCLYDIKENDGIRNLPKRRVGEEEQKFPSVYLDLYYMLIPFSRGDMKYRPAEEQKLLGKMIQVLRDYPVLSERHYQIEEEAGRISPRIELLDINYEDKTRIWSSLQEPIQIALYCRVTPVELESGRSERVKRVREIQMQFGERGDVYG